MQQKLVVQRLYQGWKTTTTHSMLVWSLWITAAVTCVAGYVGVLYWPLAGLLAFACFLLARLLRQALSVYPRLARIEQCAALILLATWLLHAVQLFTPEVGFDALWYHLPVAAQNAAAHRFVFQPDVYQSANPLFSDSVFMLGFLVMGAAGTKLVAYVFGLGLLVVVYQLARQFLPRHIALPSVAVISTFQVVAWQSSSFYIDNAVAFWLCAAALSALVWLQTKHQKHLVAVGLLLGAALASKLFLLLLLPMIVGIALITRRTKYVIAAIVVTFLALMVAAPQYLFAWHYLEHPFYSLVHHSATISGIGAGQTLGQHVLHRIWELPRFLWHVGFTRDYTTPLLLLFAPLLWREFWRQQLQPKHWVLISLAAMLLSIWWFVPPLSTRYGLAGFIGATIFVIAVLHREYKKNAFALQIVILTLAVVAVLPRGYVALKSLRYIAGIETKQEYLQRYLDGNVDTVLMRWHQDVFPTDNTQN